MIEADAFVDPQVGTAADARFVAIVRHVAETYAPPHEARLPATLAALVARLMKTEGDPGRSRCRPSRDRCGPAWKLRKTRV